MKTSKSIKLAKISAVAAALSTQLVHAYADGLNTEQFESWVNSYLGPLQQVLLWVIPLTVGIYMLVKAVQWFSKEAEGEQQPGYWVTVKKGIIVGVIAESIDLILTMFSIG